MSHIIALLSGNIPGGIILIALALLFINLTLHFLSRSGLIVKRMREKYVIFNTLVIVLYGLLWFATKDAPPLKRIIILPVMEKNTAGKVPADFTLAELFYRNRTFVHKGFILHGWPWLYETLHDAADNYNVWMKTARKFKAHTLIIPQRDNKNLIIKIIHPAENDSLIMRLPVEQDMNTAARAIIRKEIWMDTWHDIPNARISASIREDILRGRYVNVLEKWSADTSLTVRILTAQALVYKGLQRKMDFVKRRYVSEKNPDFEKAKSILIPLIRARRDRAPAAYLLGRMALREQEYENAEIYLKKALVDDYRDARVYYALGFLHTTRLEELELTDRTAVLRKAIQLDPAYTEAVYELAHMYYLGSSGVESSIGIQNAFKVLNAYLNIYDEDPRILSLMALIDMKLMKLDDAEKIYTALAERYPEDSNSWYNMGIIKFTRKQYDRAESYFKKAIAMDDNADAYMYLGYLYHRLGKYDLALKYYRERVKRKDGDDDRYAKEAMKGIRKVLQQINAKADSAVTHQK